MEHIIHSLSIFFYSLPLLEDTLIERQSFLPVHFVIKLASLVFSSSGNAVSTRFNNKSPAPVLLLSENHITLLRAVSLSNVYWSLFFHNRLSQLSKPKLKIHIASHHSFC